jgi:ABC-type nickel/cobalt efflux system permease component RcnA
MKMFGAITSFTAAVCVVIFVGLPFVETDVLQSMLDIKTSSQAVPLAGVLVLLFGVLLLVRTLTRRARALFWEAVDENYLHHQAHMRSVNESRRAA